ncbi:reprolysin-like metallopeptidase [Flavobacterium sp. DSP2-3-1]|uniref:reprolysin-like metallopeptidase n=1 Tax=Flavobacterium sp. DSP2-3-1 TaxID=2804620 RepID=UPI003CEEE559
MKKITLITFFFISLCYQFSAAQSINNWKVKNSSELSKTVSKPDRKIIPNKYKVFSLDFKSLKTNFKSASKRGQNNKLATTLLLDFPLENGTTESFLIEKTSVLHPDLEAKYPEIQSFYGVSKKNPLNKIHISISPEGFTGVITGEKTIYIDPYSKNDVNDYIVYDRTDYERGPDDSFVCNAIIDETINNTKLSSNAKISSATDGNLRTYRLALACTSAYSLYYGNTIAQVLAAMNTTITRVNSIFRRDLSVVFQIVASNDRLIYINGFNKDASPDPDPYDNYDGSQMLGSNTTNITGLITVGTYDIGHVFSTGGGGIAGTGPCTAASKGRGVTGIVTPQFDPFDIDYVCHEIGHQFGAGHTYYNACFAATKVPATDEDYEPGSASTIMGYAGICAPNVQGNSDAYFHARSIEQMTTAIAGHTCVTGTSSGNAAPIVAVPTAHTIPKSTPFILTGSANDTNTVDALTYTWEQYDKDDGGIQPPTSTNTLGPVFRSLMPTSDPSRTFPNLAAVISNTTPTWEVLPNVARTLNFRLTVRDNSPLGGRTDFKAVAITVGTAGPFLVATPNTGSEIWYVGETKAVTWNVASTNTATYSTTVNIKLSTDGGYTYPITLASAVANNGTANIIVPNNIGKLNRIKVEAAANIFFDISNANFEIKSGKFEMVSAASTQSVCKPANAVYTINYTPAPAFSETTTFSAGGAPAGSTITFSPTTRSISGTFTMTVSNTSGVAAGNYPITIKGISTTANVDFPVLLNVFDNTIGNVTLASPSNGATNQQTSSLLQWNSLTSASSYLVQISTSPTFSTITESATVTGTSYQTTLLAQGTINYWRVKPTNSCTSGSFSEVYVFQIANDLCKTYTNVTFEPNAVWEIGTTNAVNAKITVPDNIIISKVSFYMKGTHAALSDLKMQFSGPTGIFAEIYNRDCNAANFDVTFDDSGIALPVPCSVTLSGVKQASQSLSKFNGSSSLGTWTLLATDRVAATSGGTFSLFNVIICGKLQIINNITVANNALTLSQGATATLSLAKLAATQPTATTAQLIYTITQLPVNGTLKLNNIAMAVGGIFTQADINNNLLSYTNNGINSNPDSFKFSVNGVNLALLGGQTYNINVCGAPIPNITTLTNVIAQCSATASVPTATSNCYGSISGTTPTVFPITAQGTTIITWTYNDGNGNITTQEQTVVLDDTNAPTVPVLANITGQCAVTPVSPTTTDACRGTITGTTITTFPITTSGTTVITWKFSDGNGQSVTANQNVIISSTTWNGTLWSDGLPTASSGVIISADYTAITNFSACSLTVNNNAVVLVKSGFNLDIYGDVTVSPGASLTFENNTNLIQIKNTNTNSGSIKINRQSSPLMRQDYIMWASPVATQQLQSFSPLTLSTRFYTYNPLTDLYVSVANPATTNFELGKGYLIRLPNTHPTTATIWEGQFQGVPNNGNYNLPVSINKYNAIGNPYPSTLNANTFITANGITEALYFWRKTNNTLTSSYATYTTAGGTANAGGSSSIVPNGIIQIGQGFIAKATSSSISFTNAMRLANTNNQFFKTKSAERNRIWLNLSKETIPVNQMMLAYMTDATSGIDAAIDGRYINDNPIALNSLIENEEFVIQGKGLPFSDTDIVPLSFKTNTSGSYSIALDQVDGLFANNQNIFLNDQLTGIVTDLKKSSYSFSSNEGTFNDRFRLTYKTSESLGIEIPVFDANSILIYNQKGVLHINSGTTEMKTIRLFDLRGRLLVEQNEVNAKSTSIKDFGGAHQTVLVQITSNQNKIVTKKIVY